MFSFNASALVRFVTSAAKAVFKAASAAVLVAASAAKLLVNVASAFVRFVTSAAKLVVNVASALVRFDTSVAKLFVKTTSAAARIAASLVNAFDALTVPASTYVFTAFCVGYNTSLVPRVVFVDLFTTFSFNKSAFVRLVTSVAKLVVKTTSALARIADSLFNAFVALTSPASTYVLTAF